MPLGYQQRLKYGHTIRTSGDVGGKWDIVGRPLKEYDAVFTYRSGKRSKLLSDEGNSYSSLVQSGSLSDQMRKRNEFLQQQIRDNLEPTTGSPGAFSCTGDTGHPFASYKLSTTDPYAHASFKQGSYWSEQDVTFSPYMPMPNFADPFGNAVEWRHPAQRFTYFTWPTGNLFPGGAYAPIVTNAVKNAVGSGVIASANPWAPKASLAQTILELMTGDVPSVVKNIRKYVRDLQSLKKTAGSDWLNIQFGWVPLANDIHDTIATLLKLHMLLLGSDDYRRTRGGDLGTWARVSTDVNDATLYFGNLLYQGFGDDVPQFKRWKGSTGAVGVGAGYLGSTGSWSRTTRVSADFRFSAKYHRGARANARERGYIERATELLGLEVTPEVLWELTPWTWLLDWASNLGSLASNLSRLDWSNVLLDYAYLTFVVKTESSVSWQGPKAVSSVLNLSHGFIAQGMTSIEKVREQASPYGFSVSWDGLNPFQLSILAALGMSRGR